MISLTPQTVFEAALWIQLCKIKSLEVKFLPENIQLHLPTLNLFSVYCTFPLEDLMVVLTVMENQHLVKKEQRIGMWTTPQGNRLVADIIEKQFRRQARALFGKTMLKVLLKRLRTGLPEPQIGTADMTDDIKLSDNHTKKPVFIVRNIQKIVTCECCQKKFFTNDRRRICCDQCKSLSLYEKNRSRKLREVNF